jgi:hypothetical protein
MKFVQKINSGLETSPTFVYVFAAVQLWSVECDFLAFKSRV